MVKSPITRNTHGLKNIPTKTGEKMITLQLDETETEYIIELLKKEAIKTLLIAVDSTTVYNIIEKIKKAMICTVMSGNKQDIDKIETLIEKKAK